MDPDGLAQFVEEHRVAAVILIGFDGELICWRHPDASTWETTALIRRGLNMALHAAPELQHESGLRT